MCGIAGYMMLRDETPATETLIRRMTDDLAHRGPDGAGYYVKDRLALGHRRLSIIDLSTGTQPMLSDDEKLVLVFNGEIFNYIELRDELRSLGHSFNTESDTEVILKAYKQWGHDCQKRFNGMWAFALWDVDSQELFLSRDRFGEKPLFYCQTEEAIVFASEIKSIFSWGVQKEIRPELTELYLALTNIPAPDTFYKTVFKLRPAHYLIVKQGIIVCEQSYWKFPQIAEPQMLKNQEEVYKTFETLFNDAVRIRMRSDVPFGAFLSGGLDSSAVVAAMSKYTPHAVKTFTIGFKQAEYDERELAAKVAERFGTDHTVAEVKPVELESVLDRTASFFDEPFGDSSAIPTDIVSGQAARQVKMVLTGDGGDELLSGYTIYRVVKLTSSIRRWMPKVLRNGTCAVLRLMSAMSNSGLRYKLEKLASAVELAEKPFPLRMAYSTAFADLDEIKQLTRHIPGVIPVERYFEQLLSSCIFHEDFYKLMYVHYHHHLPNDFLVKVDRMSMANSLETRLPFLDYRLVEFMAGVHQEVKLQGWELKSVLRNTVGKALPEQILRSPKRGFAVPLREWFKDREFYTKLDSQLVRVKEVLGAANISKLIDDNRTGKKDHGNFLWALLQLEASLATTVH